MQRSGVKRLYWVSILIAMWLGGCGNDGIAKLPEGVSIFDLLKKE